MSVPDNLKNIVEAALLAAGRALSLEALQNLFNEIECPTKKELRAALEALDDWGRRYRAMLPPDHEELDVVEWLRRDRESH